MARPVKESAKYVITLLAFVVIAYVPSWCAVYSYWIGGHVFHSVRAVRIGDALGPVVLFPIRTLLEFSGDGVDQTTRFTDPKLYAWMNAALVGILAYVVCRRWIIGGTQK